MKLSNLTKQFFLVDDLMLRNYMNLDKYSKSIKVAKKVNFSNFLTTKYG